jgi:ferredoxin
MTAQKSLRVNPAVCDGFGYCAELLPDMIDLDEWGFPILRRGAVVPPELLVAAREAVKFCPRRALALVDAPAPVAVGQPSLRRV